MGLSREPGCRHCRLLERALQQRDAQNRRLVTDLDWAEEQVRVYRRLVERLVTEKDSREDTPCAPTNSPPTTGNGSTD